MEILDGKKLSQEILEDIKKRVDRLETKPQLAVVMVGEHPATLSFVKQKKKY